MNASPPEEEIVDVSTLSNEILREARSKSPSQLKIELIRSIVQSKLEPIYDRVIKPLQDMLDQQLNQQQSFGSGLPSKGSLKSRATIQVQSANSSDEEEAVARDLEYKIKQNRNFTINK